MATESKTDSTPETINDKKYTVTVIGGGSYGTALATVVARKGYPVKLYVRDKEQCAHINEVHKNNKRLRSYEIPHNVKAVTDVGEACKGTDLIIHALPAQHTLSFLEMHKKQIPVDVPYVCTAKGIHLETKKLMSELIPEVLGRKNNLAYLSGPSFAVEMMEKHPMSVVVASEDKACARFVQRVINSMWFRVYITTDVIGVEVGGSLKNPLAIGAGIANGLGYGQSTLAGIVTRGYTRT
ncbi:hypothetical protein RFI_21587 [Reticulomyxa filosa]|uniref:Glycerol-3-phosphate dehydrogenase [NAD(+)] n=1 Tax=Reticulomyxa filosa TaxID=46433 RepID=X6MQQ4_RETFI|nr:hypothetical protein RFI_21587 [Reticulomyxa filosa]|eukprot:ETO15777.1 hypothetical protein RFI_21587 [Reticulomyxa filosa]